MDDNHDSIDICKGQEIVVQVEEAQRDLILVTYNHGTQVFQGVLLDSTKGQLPCGIYPPGGEFPPKPPPDLSAGDNEDKLYSVKQRHTYFQQDGTLQELQSKDKKGIQLRKSISLTQRFKNSRMTVRLRPRQVLCSKCQSICNEKSENVSGAKGQRATEPPTAAKGSTENSRGNTRSARDKGNQEQQESNSSHSRRSERSPQKSVMLVPKLVKLKPSEIEAATNRRSPSARGTRSDSDSCDNELNLGLIPNPAYSVLENNNSSEGKVPKLKLSANICTASESQEGKKKGRIPKMTISTLAISPPRLEASKDNDKVSDAKNLSIPKMILTTTGIVSEYVSDKKDKENTKIRKESGDSRTDAKELRLRSGNIHKLTITAAGQGYNESLSDRLSPIPKLTILPVVQKKEAQEDKETTEIKHNKIVKSHSEEIPSEKMSLRKKRSLGSMEDLWDESVFDETAKKHRREDSEEEKEEDAVKPISEEKECLEGEKPKSTPVLKISFGPEGKGTVLKIPSKSTVVSLSTPEVETEEEISKKSKDMSAKAARKALKKAKKEAQRKAMMGNASPASVMGGMSPRFGGMSPLRLGGVSPARLGGFSPARFGGTSPARFGGMSPARAAAVDLSTRDLPTKKHKHKVKHKKKHKDERRHKFQEENKIQVDVKSDSKDSCCPPDSTDADIPVENITPDDAWNASEAREGAVDLTNPNLARQLPNSKVVAQPSSTLQQSRHKLSISIKRVSNASYVACDSSHSDGERTVTPTSNSVLDDKEKSPVLKCTVENTVIEKTKDKVDVHECSKNVLPDTSTFQELEEDKKYLSVVEGPENYSNDNFSTNTYRMETPEPSLPGSDSPGSDDPCNGAIPDFPSRAPSIEEMSHTSASLLMKLSWQEVNHCNVSDGRIMKIGDVVWGKIHGFPWWPAKVIAIRILREVNGETKWQQAHVSWYGSSTQSLMPADTLQPFLQMFKVRYNKRKRGPYREAIKQATCEAEQTSVDPLMSLHLDHHQGHLPLQHQSQVQLRTSNQVMNQKYLKPLQLNQQYVGNPPQQISPPIQPHSAPVSQQPHQLHHQQPQMQQQQPQQQPQQQQQQQKTPDNLPVLSASPREVDVVS